MIVEVFNCKHSNIKMAFNRSLYIGTTVLLFVAELEVEGVINIYNFVCYTLVKKKRLHDWSVWEICDVRLPPRLGIKKQTEIFTFVR